MRSMRIIPLVAMAVGLASCADSGPESSAAEALRLGDPLYQRLTGIHDAEAPWVEMPYALALWRDSIAVADVQAARIHLLAPTLDGGRSFGVEGEGPGEIQRPGRLHPRGDTLVVYDLAGRLTWFDPRGEASHLLTLFIPSANPGFAVEAERRVWHPIRDDDWYVRVVAGTDSAVAIPRDAGLAHANPMPGTTMSSVVPHASGPILVDFDHARVIFTGVDETRATRPPPALLEQLLARAAELTDLPDRWATPILHAGPATDGVVVWFPLDTGPIAALVTPDGRWTPILPGTGERPGYPSSILMVNDRLYVGSSDGIRAYPLLPVSVVEPE